MFGKTKTKNVETETETVYHVLRTSNHLAPGMAAVLCYPP